MRTVIIDNSLCALPISDDAGADDIYFYIEALARMGIRYVELDFRALMKLRHLPEGIGYIFRPVAPMFLKFTELFQFDYIALSITELSKYSELGVPVLFTLPLPGDFMTKSPKEIIKCAEEAVKGKVTSVRMRGDFPLLSVADAVGYLDFLKKRVAIPVDICPTNGRRTALNTAIQFFNGGADSITVTMGSPDRYCALEELVMTFLMMFGSSPDDLSMPWLSRAAAYHTRVFNSGLVNDIPELVRLFENDFDFLQNIDTGEQVYGAEAPRRQHRFSQTFQDFLNGIKSDWSIRGCDPLPEEAAESYSTSLFNNEADKKKLFGRIPPFLN